MRYSANLNIIIKAIEKASYKISRDYVELEILQSNPNSANKFANSCYQRVKKTLIDDLTKMRPDYNFYFSDGDKIINNENGEFSFVICPIDGLNNLSRCLSDFAISIALIHKNLENNSEETIGVAIYKVIGGDLYYTEKGYGAFLNNRKISSSSRLVDDNLVGVSSNSENLEKELRDFGFKKSSLRNYGCKTLEIAYLASAKIDFCYLDLNDLQKKFILIASESKAKLAEKNDKILITAKNIKIK